MTDRATRPGAAMLVIIAIMFVVSVGFGLVVPLLPTITREFGAGTFALGAMTASYAFAQFLLSPYWGALSDRVGRKPILMVGICGLSLSFLTMAFAQSFLMLFTGRVLGGILGSATLPVGQAIAAELSGPQQRAQAMGRIGAAMSTGFTFGPLIGGLLAPLGMSVPFFAAAAAGGLIVVLAAWILKEPSERHLAVSRPSDPGARNVLAALRSPGLPFFLLAFIIMFAHSSIITLLPLYLSDRFAVASATVGMFYAFNGITGAVLQGTVVGPLTKRRGERFTIALGLSVGACGFLSLVVAPRLAFVIPSLAMAAFSLSLVRPSVASALSKITTMPQGVTMGLQSAFDSLGRVIGPLWAGVAYDLWLGLPFASSSLVLATAFLLFRTYVQADMALRPSRSSEPAGR